MSSPVVAESNTNGRSSVLTITDVFHAPPSEAVPRFHLDSPKAGTVSDTYSIAFDGWVMGKSSPPVRLEVSRPRHLLAQIRVGSVPRPDLPRVFPDIPWAVTNSGFYASISAFKLPCDFEFHVEVVHADASRTPIATVRGRRELAPMSDSGLRPLMVTTLGRSGSHFLMDQLSHHPAIVSYPPFHTEVRVASYWTEVFLALSEPTSYRQAIEGIAADAEEGWWLGRQIRTDEPVDDHELVKWVGRDQVEDLMRHCRDNIEAFYRRLAGRNGKAPAYFVEKRLPSIRRLMWTTREMFPGAREIILVRDLRDVLCSILAYNQQLGGAYFNRGLAPDDEDYIRNHLGPSADMLVDVWQERSSSAFLLRYEDLVLQPRETLSSLLAYLGLEETEEALASMMGVSSKPASLEEQQHRTVANARESVGRWRRDMRPELIEVCEEVFGRAQRVFGYASPE